jgi:hypothetical protein
MSKITVVVVLVFFAFIGDHMMKAANSASVQINTARMLQAEAIDSI